VTVTEALGEFALLAGLSDEHRGVVASVARPDSFVAGDRIVDEEEPADGCWLIRSGRVALQTRATPEADLTIQTLGPGEVLGWSWLVPPHHWQFGAVATEPVEAIRLDGIRLRELAAADPALGYALALAMLQVLGNRLQSTRARLLDLYGAPR
jgi:CRP/FNR family transcriptional regulator, cyclic AMP receptor protein